MADWTVRDLEEWDLRIRDVVRASGLDPYPQEFEICDHNEMLGYMAYHGMPSHYPHWSYGKSFEKLKTLYDYGVSGLPYEMVINSNPATAYLMRDNSLALQVLTIAHVYGHNDFFKNNFHFKGTKAEYTLSTFKAHADRIRAYVEDPSIGLERVERTLDAAHGLSDQCRRNPGIRKLTQAEQRERLLEAAQPRHDPFQAIHERPGYEEPDLQKNPPSPDADLLLFLRDHSPRLDDWQKDLLTIVHEEAQYFLPQIETKIMNEGWASYWHREILNALELPQDLHLEFLVRHNQVVRPIPGSVNPYHLGLAVWDAIFERFEHPSGEEEARLPGGEGRAKLFEVRSADRDISFLRRFLDEKIIRELDLFEYQPKGGEWVVSEVADDDGWRAVKETLLRNVGLGTVPVIAVEDAAFGPKQGLRLRHEHDGRDLSVEAAERTLEYVHRLWGKEAALETIVQGKTTLLEWGDEGFETSVQE